MSRRALGLLLLTTSAALAGACSDDDGDAAGGADAGRGADAASGRALTLVTYNAGLLDAVGYVPQRAPLVVDALTALDADILCVQEMWEQAPWDALVDENRDLRPHVQRFENMPGVAGRCTTEEFVPVRECAEASCSDPGPAGLVSCTTESCLAEVTALSSSCVSCLVDNADLGDFDAIESACSGGTAAGGPGPTPPAERSYFLGGSFGVGLLSRLPLLQEDSLVLDSSTNRRGILHSRVEVPGLGELSVFCTHLTPDLPGLAYDGSYGSFAGENAAHVDALIDFVDATVDAGEPVVVLGDLNTGPAGDGYAAELPDSFARLVAAGLEAPYLDAPDTACTFCGGNPLVLEVDTGVDAVLDHVLVRDLDATVTARRILTEPTEVDAGDDAGTADTIALSDHYGVEARITR